MLSTGLGAGLKGAVKRLIGGKLRIGKTDDVPFESREENGVLAECFSDMPRDERVLNGWDSLAQGCSLFSAFQSSVWHAGLVKVSIKAGRSRVIAVSRGGAMLGVLPMSLADGGYLETGVPGLADYLDPPVRDGEEEIFWRSALAYLHTLWDSSVSGLVLQNVRQYWPSRDILKRIAGDCGFDVEETEVDKVVRFALPPTWEQYLETLDGHHRREMMRKVRRGEKEGNVRLTLASAIDQADASVKKALELSEASGGDRGEAIHNFVRPLLLEIGTELMRRDWLRIKFLWIKEDAAACTLNMPSRIGPLVYNGGFSPDFHWWSPGTVITALAVKQAIDEKATWYDMLRGSEEYKYRFGGKDEPVLRMVLKPR